VFDVFDVHSGRPISICGNYWHGPQPYPARLVSSTIVRKRPHIKVLSSPVSRVAPNVRFEVHDARDEWTFAENHFDFINARTLAGSILDWPKFLALCYRYVEASFLVRYHIFLTLDFADI
jgi:hypothetical protein